MFRPSVFAATLAVCLGCACNNTPSDMDGGAGGEGGGTTAQGGGSSAGGAAAGGSAGGSTAGGSTAGGAAAGGSAAGGSAAGGSSGGMTAGGAAAGGSAGGAAGGAVGGGSSAGGTAGGAPVNTAPVLGALAAVTVNEGATATVTLTATDAENDPLTFSIMGAPSFVTLSGTTLTIAPDFTNAGTHSVTVIVSDGALQSQGTLSITVTNVNRPPVLMPIAAVTMSAGTTQMVTLLATDPDGDTISFSLTNAPTFAMLAGNVLTLSPAANVVDSRMVTVTATDTSSATDNETFQLTVTAPANQPPVVSMLAQVDALDMPVAAGAMTLTAPQLRASVDDPENAQVRLEAEVVLTSATFTNVATHTGPLSTEGTLTLPLSSFAPGAYKWQLRALDAAGNPSPWQGFNSGNTAFTLIAGSITGGLQVNGAATATNNLNVTLTISASTTAPATVTEMCFSNDGVTFSDCGAPVTTKAWALSSGDGTKTVRVRVRNSLNQTLVLNDSIILDTTPPQVTGFAVNANAAATNMQTVNLAWTATDALSGVAGQQASNDGSTFSNVSASPAVWMLGATQGQVTVTLRVTDVAGNQGQATDTIFFDTASPTISTAVLNGGAPWTRFTTVNLAVTAGDGATSSGLFQVCVSGNVTPGCLPYAATVPVTLTAGIGMKTVLVTVSDNAGNVSLASMASVGLDQATPTLGSINLNLGAAFTNDPQVSASLLANDIGGSGLAQVQCQTDLGAFVAPVAYAVTISHTMTGADGLKTVGCKVIDGAGNESSVNSDTITLDTGTPTGTFVVNPGNPSYANNVNTTLVFTASDPSGVTHRCANTTGTPPSGAMDPCFQPIAFTSFALPIGDGLKTVSVWFRDGANNVSTAAATDTITLDQTAPTLSIAGAGLGIAAGGSSTNSLSPIFNHLATDATSGLGQVCTGEVSPPANCVAYTTTPTVTLTAGDGMKTGFIRVSDGAGNVSFILSDTITLDQTAPGVSNASINGGAMFTNSLNVSVTSVATDGVGVTQMQLSNSGVGGFGAPIPYLSPVSTTLSVGDGTKTILVRVLDAAGNQSGVASDTITLDTIAPTTTISVNSGARYTQAATVTVAFVPTETGSGVAQRCLKEVAVGAPAPATPTAADVCFVAYSATAMHTLAAQGDRRLHAWLLDNAGNITPAPATYDIFFDSVVPTTPTSASATAGHRTVSLSWNNSSDATSGVQGYEVGLSLVTGGPYVYGTLIPHVGGTTNQTLTLPNGVTQFIVVRSVDNAGNRSPSTTQFSATPRWPFSHQSRAASNNHIKSMAFGTSNTRYYIASGGGGLYTSDDSLLTFTRRDPMTDDIVNHVSVSASGDVWLVGPDGYMARSTDDGVTFETLVNNDPVVPKRDLYSFTFAGTTGMPPFQTSWWVGVGLTGRVVRGSTSFLNSTPTFDVVPMPTSNALFSVARCSSAVGACSTGSVLVAVGNAGAVYRSTDNGATWSSVALPSGYTTQLKAVVALPNLNSFYIGGDAPAGHGPLLFSNNGGVTFSEVSGFGDVTTIETLTAQGTDVWMTANTTVAEIIKYSGSTRTDQVLPTGGNSLSKGLVARSATEIASGGLGGTMTITTAPPNWVRRNVEVTPSWARMTMPSTFASTLWAVGATGSIFHSPNSGGTWVSQGVGLTTQSLFSVDSVDTNGTIAGTLLFATGNAGTILKSTNGGGTWALDPDTGIVTVPLTGVSCRTSTSCNAVGFSGTILTWNGSNWVVTATGGTRTYRSITAYFSGLTNRAVVIGDSGVLHTLTGSTWTQRADINGAVNFRGVAHKHDAAGLVLAVGSGGAIYKSTDHGATFTPRASGVTVQLEDVSHVTGTAIWYAVGGQGTVLKSTDDGETWVALVSNVAEASLNGVCTGSNTSRVWAGGGSGHLIFSATGGL